MIKPRLVPKDITPTKIVARHKNGKINYVYIKLHANDVSGAPYFYRVSTKVGWPRTWLVLASNVIVF